MQNFSQGVAGVKHRTVQIAQKGAKKIQPAGSIVQLAPVEVSGLSI
ncbi:hypothetical protein [Mesorhizobium sp. M5C.F.Cr.IN.023.01.1.1]|nr:hypothetical protein [Mesorhizobium sp. M5C.F.Cr.IN.023.01.1.1]